eukprot:4244597-Pyramimonas_sp.AAC.1
MFVGACGGLSYPIQLILSNPYCPIQSILSDPYHIAPSYLIPPNPIHPAQCINSFVSALAADQSNPYYLIQTTSPNPTHLILSNPSYPIHSNPGWRSVRVGLGPQSLPKLLYRPQGGRI